MVHAHNGIQHSWVKKFISLASSFIEKLPTTAACTTGKGKAGANVPRPTPGMGDFFFSKRRCL